MENAFREALLDVGIPKDLISRQLISFLEEPFQKMIQDMFDFFAKHQGGFYGGFVRDMIAGKQFSDIDCFLIRNQPKYYYGSSFLNTSHQLEENQRLLDLFVNFFKSKNYLVIFDNKPSGYVGHVVKLKIQGSFGATIKIDLKFCDLKSDVIVNPDLNVNTLKMIVDSRGDLCIEFNNGYYIRRLLRLGKIYDRLCVAEITANDQENIIANILHGQFVVLTRNGHQTHSLFDHVVSSTLLEQRIEKMTKRGWKMLNEFNCSAGWCMFATPEARFQYLKEERRKEAEIRFKWQEKLREKEMQINFDPKDMDYKDLQARKREIDKRFKKKHKKEQIHSCECRNYRKNGKTKRTKKRGKEQWKKKQDKISNSVVKQKILKMID